MTEIGTKDDSEDLIRQGARLHQGGQMYPKLLPTRSDSPMDKVPDMGLGIMERIRKRLGR